MANLKEAYEPERQVQRVTTVQEFDENGNLIVETVEREFFVPSADKYPSGELPAQPKYKSPF